jgi:hypothetical protein
VNLPEARGEVETLVCEALGVEPLVRSDWRPIFVAGHVIALERTLAEIGWYGA